MLTAIQEQLLAAKGYIFGGVRKLPSGEYVAEATKNFTLPAAHIGESPRIAAKNLVKMVLRP